MHTEKSHRLIWRSSVCIGLIALAAIALALGFESSLFGKHDPFNHRAYVCGGSVASLAALSIGIAIRGIEVRASKAGCIAGMLLGTLALLVSAAFLLGTILPGD